MLFVKDSRRYSDFEKTFLLFRGVFILYFEFEYGRVGFLTFEIKTGNSVSRAFAFFRVL